MNLLRDLERYAMDRLSKREYSGLDLKRSLDRRLKLLIHKNSLDPAHYETLVSEILEKLTRSGMLSDERYTKMMVRHQLGRKLGFRAISQKLKQKGIKLTSAQFQQYLENEGITDSKQHELSQIQTLLARKYPGYREDQKIKTRAFGFLVRRGFSVDQITKALKLSLEIQD